MKAFSGKLDRWVEMEKKREWVGQRADA